MFEKELIEIRQLLTKTDICVKKPIVLLGKIGKYIFSLCCIFALGISTQVNGWVFIVTLFCFILSIYLVTISIAISVNFSKGIGFAWDRVIENTIISVQEYKRNTLPIGEMLEKIRKIDEFIPNIMKANKSYKLLLEQDSYKRFQNAMIQSIEIVISILTNIRGELQQIINTQINTLQQAKVEVEKNIGGMSELEQVSELQKVRLDQQIEQFYKLQKILMKV